MFETFRPLGSNVLVKRIKNEEKTASGLYIPDTAKEKAQTGTVLAVGPGRTDTAGKTFGMAVKVGDMVYFGKYSGTEADEAHLIVKEEDILGVI
jgi:chaperonin GroES